MARPATGNARWNPAERVWEARVTIPGVGREAVPMLLVPPCVVAPAAPPLKCACASCAQAKRAAKIVSDKSRRDGSVPGETGETWNEWHVRYLETHESLGRQTREMTGAGRKWLSERIGTVPMVALKRDHVVGIRDAREARRHRAHGAVRRNAGPDAVRLPQLAHDGMHVARDARDRLVRHRSAGRAQVAGHHLGELHQARTRPPPASRRTVPSAAGEPA
jgi:hypothetical protein